MSKFRIIQKVLCLAFSQCVFVLHLQTPLVLDNAFLFLKSTEAVINYQFLNKVSFWAKEEYKKLQAKNDCALRRESHS